MLRVGVRGKGFPLGSQSNLNFLPALFLLLRVGKTVIRKPHKLENYLECGGIKETSFFASECRILSYNKVVDQPSLVDTNYCYEHR